MTKYRTRPCEIEALVFEDSDDSVARLIEFTDGNFTPHANLLNGVHYDYAIINTLEGDMKALLGDYIIRGLNGEYYPCKPSVFHKKYELIK